MSLLLVLIGALTIVVGLIGLLLPALPGMPLLVGGSVLIAWADGFTRVGYLSLIVIALLGLVGSAVDYLASVLGARRGGASRWGLLGAIGGLVVGLPFGIPGLVLGPAVGAVALEYARDQEFRRAARAGAGVFVGFVIGTIVKYALAAAIIGILATAYLF